MEIFERNQYQFAKRLLAQFPAIALLGARQTGKTTIAKQLGPDWRYLDLENPNDYALLTRDPILFFEQVRENLIIDEAQLYPPLFSILRGVIDKHRQQKGRFILTGSSSYELHQSISESLAGRIANIEIGTLKANEYHQTPLSAFYNVFKEKLSVDRLVTGQPPLSLSQMNAVWLRGGYPEPNLADKEDEFWIHWMNQYYMNYLNRDIAALFPRMNKLKYQRFIKILANLSSTIINRSELGRALEISETSAREYLSITEGTFLWRELLSYEHSDVKSIVKMPKGYIRDSGLLHYLLNIRTLNDLYTHNIVGHSFEGFVIEEIIKGLHAAGIINWKAYYFRTRKGSEVDLILEGYFGILPIEIKYSSQVSLKQLRALSEFIEKHNTPFGLVINQSTDVMWLTKNILQVPVGWV